MVLVDFIRGLASSFPYAQYVVFIAIIIATFVGAKLLYFLFSKIFKLMVSKTETRLDDILVESLQGPVVLLFLIFGFRIATEFLTLSEKLTLIFSQITAVHVVVNIAWFVSRIINSLLKN